MAHPTAIVWFDILKIVLFPKSRLRPAACASSVMLPNLSSLFSPVCSLGVSA